LQVINFIGTIYTGHGRGKFFIELPWVMQQLKQLTGITPYFGTLNLHLTPNGTEQRTYLTPQNGLLIKPKNGYLPGYLYKAKIFNTVCYVVLPDVPNYPKDTLEIIATENLRNKFNIKDGDMITILVTI
jgi:CTP-dependent riboflavin kinase